eukprot:gene13972-biopygen13417
MLFDVIRSDWGGDPPSSPTLQWYATQATKAEEWRRRISGGGRRKEVARRIRGCEAAGSARSGHDAPGDKGPECKLPKCRGTDPQRALGECGTRRRMQAKAGRGWGTSGISAPRRRGERLHKHTVLVSPRRSHLHGLDGQQPCSSSSESLGVAHPVRDGLNEMLGIADCRFTDMTSLVDPNSLKWSTSADGQPHC